MELIFAHLPPTPTLSTFDQGGLGFDAHVRSRWQCPGADKAQFLQPKDSDDTSFDTLIDIGHLTLIRPMAAVIWHSEADHRSPSSELSTEIGGS